MTLGFNKYKVGDRIGQIIIMPYPQIEFEEVEELSETERGTKGYGSSGN
jgi:dUTP pyrophosphatase